MKKRKEESSKSKQKAKILKENVYGALDLPKEIGLNMPLITALGNEQLHVENFKGIVEYSEEKIRLSTSCGIFKIEGTNLYIKEMSSERALIVGKLYKLEFIL